MWYLQGYFTHHPLVTIFRVTSELSMQLILYQDDKPLEGDEWVTSETKWITVTTFWGLKPYNAEGDELTSRTKILFSMFFYFMFQPSQRVMDWMDERLEAQKAY